MVENRYMRSWGLLEVSNLYPSRISEALITVYDEVTRATSVLGGVSAGG
uniref:Uncharacterized protein n=1 Tax=Schistosoma mansoni TaxID=6183 RepID=A0AA82N565_SCHMA